jgi:hypothetical protein
MNRPAVGVASAKNVTAARARYFLFDVNVRYAAGYSR